MQLPGGLPVGAFLSFRDLQSACAARLVTESAYSSSHVQKTCYFWRLTLNAFLAANCSLPSYLVTTSVKNILRIELP